MIDGIDLHSEQLARELLRENNPVSAFEPKHPPRLSCLVFAAPGGGNVERFNEMAGPVGFLPVEQRPVWYAATTPVSTAVHIQ
jgi:hypothetical protein